ncbi:MAG: Fe-S cluster assembly protein SufB [Candidatus Magasanikbacteria bacterium]|nr:Fe-S cluster assembly protein SufB [Candidatus Magasanikbacteria bacterium]
MTIPIKTKKIISGAGDKSAFSFHTKTNSVFTSKKGLDENIIRELSRQKSEPAWMLEFRLQAYKIFLEKKMPDWGADLTGINFENIHYYVRPQDKTKRNWDDVPEEIKNTFEKLGIPEAERKFLAGTGAQFESEMVYHSLAKNLAKQGVIFESTDDALKNHPELFKKYFGTVIPPRDNKFAALNSAVWSGGSFIYVPKGVHVELPLQAYFRINIENMGQFERTLIIADEGSSVHYVEGCTAPTYSSDSLHSAVVEIIVKKGARVQYTTIQNWSGNVYNLVTKRAVADQDATMFWLDCNLGSKVTMKYPSIILRERGAKGEIQSLAFASKGQHQDAGGKVIHLAPDTSSTIVSKSISKNGGQTTYRGLVKVIKGAKNVKTRVVCDALMLDPASRSDTYPTMDIKEKDVAIAHEATVASIGEDELFYLMSRGLSEEQAATLIVNGFASPIIKQLPMEYAVELNRLLALEMTGSVG